MFPVLMNLLILIIMAPYRAVQMIRAYRQNKSLVAQTEEGLEAYQKRFGGNQRSSETSKVLGQAAYMVDAQHAVEASRRYDYHKSALFDRANLVLWFVQKMIGLTPKEKIGGENVVVKPPNTFLRWTGLTSIFSGGISLVDVAVLWFVVATAWPQALHTAVDLSHKVGTDVVAGVTGTAQDAGPDIREFLQKQLLEGFQGTSTDAPPSDTEVTVTEEFGGTSLDAPPKEVTVTEGLEGAAN